MVVALKQLQPLSFETPPSTPRGGSKKKSHKKRKQTKRKQNKYLIIYFLMRRTVQSVYKRIFDIPYYPQGRWGKHSDHATWTKADMTNEDHCGCDEMRQKYLQQVKKIDELVATIQKKE